MRKLGEVRIGVSCISTHLQFVYWTQKYYLRLNEDGLSLATDGRMAIRTSSLLRRPKEAKLYLFSFCVFWESKNLVPWLRGKKKLRKMYASAHHCQLFFTHKILRLTREKAFSLAAYALPDEYFWKFWRGYSLCVFETLTLFHTEIYDFPLPNFNSGLNHLLWTRKDWTRPCTWTRNVTTVDSR